MNIDTENRLQERKEKLLYDNKVIYQAYEKDFSEEKFLKFAKVYFSSANLVKLKDKASKNEPFLFYILEAEASIKNPNSFQDFLSGLKNYESIVKVDFPVSLKTSEDKILTSFSIKIYNKTSDIK